MVFPPKTAVPETVESGLAVELRGVPLHKMGVELLGGAEGAVAGDKLVIAMVDEPLTDQRRPGVPSVQLEGFALLDHLEAAIVGAKRRRFDRGRRHHWIPRVARRPPALHIVQNSDGIVFAGQMTA